MRQPRRSISSPMPAPRLGRDRHGRRRTQRSILFDHAGVTCKRRAPGELGGSVCGRRVGEPDDEVGLLGRARACGGCPRARPRPAASRMPAVSATITGRPPRSSRTSMTSRVVPASSETIAASRRASALSRLDLPTFGGPASATRKPSRSDLAAVAVVEVRTRSPPRAPAMSARASASASRGEVGLIREVDGGFDQRQRLDQPRAPALVELRQRAAACRRAWRRCASVSASMRSARPSTSARSSLPFSKARRANSPGSARRQSGDGGRAPRARPHDGAAAVDMKLRHVLAGVAPRAGEPQHQRLVEHLARLRVRGCARSAAVARPSAAAPPCASIAAPARGPETRITATPARPGALERAKIVSALLGHGMFALLDQGCEPFALLDPEAGQPVHAQAPCRLTAKPRHEPDMSENRLGQRDEPLSPPAPGQPGPLVGLGPEALAEAKRTGKPILLSVGYAACHWCHVMAHESFEDAATAARDERPVREHQGRPRGAARHRRDLHGRAASPGRAGRLAADHVPRQRGAARSGAAPTFPSRAALGPAGVRRRAAARSPRVYRDEPDKVAENAER